MEPPSPGRPRALGREAATPRIARWYASRPGRPPDRGPPARRGGAARARGGLGSAAELHPGRCQCALVLGQGRPPSDEGFQSTGGVRGAQLLHLRPREGPLEAGHGSAERAAIGPMNSKVQGMIPVLGAEDLGRVLQSATVTGPRVAGSRPRTWSRRDASVSAEISTRSPRSRRASGRAARPRVGEGTRAADPRGSVGRGARPRRGSTRAAARQAAPRASRRRAAGLPGWSRGQ